MNRQRRASTHGRAQAAARARGREERSRRAERGGSGKRKDTPRTSQHEKADDAGSYNANGQRRQKKKNIRKEPAACELPRRKMWHKSIGKMCPDAKKSSFKRKLIFDPDNSIYNATVPRSSTVEYLILHKMFRSIPIFHLTTGRAGAPVQIRLKRPRRRRTDCGNSPVGYEEQRCRHLSNYIIEDRQGKP